MKRLVTLNILLCIKSILLFVAIESKNSSCLVESLYFVTPTEITGALYNKLTNDRDLVQSSQTKIDYDWSHRRLVYYSGDENIVYSIALNGSDRSIIKSGVLSLDRFIVDDLARKIYYVTPAFRKIKSIDMKNGTETLVGNFGFNVGQIDIDPKNKSLIISNRKNVVLIRYFLDTQKVSVILNRTGNPKSLSVDPDNGAVYWIEFRDGRGYDVLCTFYNGTTTTIYNYLAPKSALQVAVGKKRIYVLDSAEKNLDYFDKANHSFLGRSPLSSSFQELAVADDYDECCTNNPCTSEHAECINYPGTYECQCDQGFTGVGIGCTDINECSKRLDNCSSSATCTNTIGGFKCHCNSGYSGNGYTCTDINECSTNLDNCSSSAICTNTMGGFKCHCYSGYSGNGYTCTDIDECQPFLCHANATCINTQGSYTCQCNQDYYSDGWDCMVDGCQQSPCAQNALCTNIPGSIICACKNGYSGNGYQCTDINECEGTPCSPVVSTKCINTDGSYGCVCNDEKGYIKTNNGACIKVERQRLLLRLNQAYYQTYGNKLSVEYRNITSTIANAISGVYSNNDDYYGTEVINLREGSVLAEFWLMFESSSTVSLVELLDAVRRNTLERLSPVSDIKEALQVLLPGTCDQSPCPPNSKCEEYSNTHVTCPCNEKYYFNATHCEEYIEVHVQIAVKGNFTEEFNNRSSPAYLKFTANAAQQLREVFKDEQYFEDVLITELRNGSVVMNFVVVYRKPGEKMKSRKLLVASSLDDATSDGTIGNLVIVGDIQVQEPPPVPTKVTFDIKTEEILVEWDPPEKSEYFSITHYITGYKTVSGTNYDNEEIPFGDNNNNKLLGGLKSDTHYVIIVYARNKHGDGDKTEEFFVKTEKKSDNDTVIIVVVVVVVVVLLVIFVVSMIYIRYRKIKRSKRTNVVKLTNISQPGTAHQNVSFY